MDKRLDLIPAPSMEFRRPAKAEIRKCEFEVKPSVCDTRGVTIEA